MPNCAVKACTRNDRTSNFKRDGVSYFTPKHAAMEILCPLVGAICLSFPALAYQLHTDNSEYVSVRLSRSLEPIGARRGNHTFATDGEDFSNARFKERKSMKRYGSNSFIPRERIGHRRIELVPPAHFKNIQNETSDNNLIDKSDVLSNQRRGLHNSDILQAICRERADHRRIEVVAPTIYKKTVQNQSNENHSISKSEALSNQRRNSHNSDGLQARPIAKPQKNYARQFIDNHQGILQSKTYEKPGYLAVNVHKARVTTVPLSLNVRWKLLNNIMNEQIQKMQVPLGADKPMQGEKHSHKPESTAQGSPKKNMSFRENAKREAQNDRGFIDSPSHGFSDSLKRYITLREKGPTNPKSPRVTGAIGIRTDDIEENIPVENPYAIFYKVHQNPEDGFIPASGLRTEGVAGALSSVEDDSKLLNTENKQQISANYESQNPNRVMKKFFNFKNNKYY